MNVKKKYNRTIKACYKTEKLAGKLVFNLNMSDGVEIKRKIKYCSDSDLYLNICQPKEKQSSKLPVFIYLHGAGGLQEVLRAGKRLPPALQIVDSLS